MKKSYKVIWGGLTPVPILMIITGFICFFAFIFSNITNLPKGTPPPPGFFAGFILFYALFLGGIFLGFLISITYFIHLVRNEALSKDMKTLWVVLFLVLHIMAMIVYWFMVVLPEPEPGQVAEEPGEAPAQPTPRRSRSK